MRSKTSGVTAAAWRTCDAIAKPSSTVRVDAAPMPALTPPLIVLPGRIMTRLLPRLEIVASMLVRAPVPMATVTMTAATPMMMPKTVSSERWRLRISARKAIVTACSRFTYGARSLRPTDGLVVDDVPVVKGDDTARKARDVELVRHHENRHVTFAIQSQKEFHDFRRGLGVERSGGLVGEDQARIVY